jgi:hypothetical protein
MLAITRFKRWKVCWQHTLLRIILLDNDSEAGRGLLRVRGSLSRGVAVE